MQKDCKYIDDLEFCTSKEYNHRLCRGKNNFGNLVKECPYYKKRSLLLPIKVHKDDYSWKRRIKDFIININLFLITRGK